MPLLQHLENLLDRLVPAVEAMGRSSRVFTPDELKTAMDTFIVNGDIAPRSTTDTFYDLRVTGRLVGELSQAKVLVGKPAKPEMYKNMRFRLQLSLLDDGHVSIRAFEHIIGLPKERKAIHKLYADRVAYMLEILDNMPQSHFSQYSV